jgi:protein-tyrosine phosphatase
MDVPFDAQRLPIQLSEADVENADLIVAIKKAEHRPMMRDQFPRWANKIHYWHIDNLDCATADEALSICESCVRFFVETLLAEQDWQEAPVRLRRAA